MNFSSDDRARSLRRFLKMALGAPPWRIRVVREVVADEARPVAIVEMTTPTGAGALPGRTTVPQGRVDRSATYTLSLYPRFLDERDRPAPLSVDEAARVAREAADLLEQALVVGLVNDDGSRFSVPYNIPVYDFARVPLSGRSRSGPADPYGWMEAEDVPVRPLQDPADPLRWAIVCDLRLSWTQGGAILDPDGPRVAGMPGTFVP